MAVVITTDLVDINLSEATTNYAILGTFATAIASSVDTYVQSAATVGGRVSANTAWAHSSTPSANLNLSVSEFHIFQWLKCISVPQLDSKLNGGLGITMSSDPTPTLTGTTPSNGLSNSKTWYVGGNEDALSGWGCYVVDPNSASDLTLGTPNAASVNRVGIRAKMLGTVGGGAVKPVNVVFDATRYGTGLTYQGDTAGNPGNFTNILSTAMSATNAWGILTSDSSIWFGAGKMDFGTTGQTSISSFKSTGQTFVWRNYPVAATFYAWRLRGAAGFATTFQLGDFTSGLVSKGNVIKGAGDPTSATHATWSLDVGADVTANIYASNLSELYRGTFTTTTTMRGCVINNFGNIVANGSTINDCSFSDLRTTAPISATYGIEVTTAATIITNSKFVNCPSAVYWNVATNPNTYLTGTSFTSGGTGYAIVLGPNCPAAIVLTDVVFSSYGITGTTNAAIHNNSGKSITITVAGLGTTPTYNNGAGATTTVISGQRTLTLTGLISGSDIVINTTSTVTQILDVDQNVGSTYAYSYTYAASTFVDIKIMKAGYSPYQVYNYNLANSDASLPIAQVIDRTYV